MEKVVTEQNKWAVDGFLLMNEEAGVVQSRAEVGGRMFVYLALFFLEDG